MKKKGDIRNSFFSIGNKKFLAVLLASISFLIYSNTIGNGYNVDDELIYDNHVLKKQDSKTPTLVRIFTEPYYKDAAGNKYEYRPIVVTTFYFEFMLFGRKPQVSHFINVILFSVTCVLIFYLLQSLFRDYKYSLSLSFITALLFAVHPLHTEAVASIKSRDELLSLLFGVLSWQCALRFIDQRRIVFWALYLLAFTGAIFSKQSTITFSLLIPASVTIFRSASIGRFAALALPITLISMSIAPVYLLYKKALLFLFVNLFLVFVYYLLSARDKMVRFITGTWKKTTSSLIHFFRVRFKLVAGAAAALIILTTAGYFFMKRNEIISEEIKKVQWNVSDRIHDFNELQVTPMLQAAAPALIPIAGRRLNFVEIPLLYIDDPAQKTATSLHALATYVRLMVIPHPLRFYYGYKQIPITDFSDSFVWFSIIFHGAMIFLMLWFFFVRKHMIAAFGIMFYIVSIIPLSNFITPIAGIIGERLAYTASLGFCIAFCYLTISLHDARHEFLKFKSYASRIFLLIVLSFTALTFMRNFNWKDHLTLMRHDIQYLNRSARAHHLLASHLAFKASEKRQPHLPENKKMLLEAEQHFKKTIEIYPDFPYVWYDLAKTYMLLGEQNKGIEAYYNSIKKDSVYATPCFELGVVLDQHGRTKEAEDAYQLAIQRDSFFVQAYTNLSYLYYKQERYRESIAVNQMALRHMPKSYDVNANLGRTYLKMNDVNNALYYLERAAAINRSDKSMLEMMAQLFESIGNYEKAEYYRGLR
ncbi:MAG TPA: tetratricopeptide repeat protein [Chitinophagales bacterium]|nr:tetratricopeptide repeat protein [Chitinophagales bacterium]